MKTSLVIEDGLFRAAQREALAKKTTLSETIAHWARVGREALRRRPPCAGKYRTFDLGGPAKVNLNARNEWRDVLDDPAHWRKRLGGRG